MSFIVEDTGGSFERCPSGIHLARCYRIVDLGTQQSEYMGQVKFLHKIMVAWEIHGQDEAGKPILMKDNRPFSIFKNYTLSWSEKANLRLDLQSWRGKPFSPEEMRRFDLKNVLGAWCLLNIIEREGKNGSTYSNVNGITPVPQMIKAAGLPAEVNKKELFVLSDPDMKMFEGFSDNLKKKIESSPEWQKRSAPKAKTDADYLREAIDDEIPF
jgi:hypothetical protein